MLLNYTNAGEKDDKVPYGYRTFAEKYGYFLKKHKLVMPIK